MLRGVDADEHGRVAIHPRDDVRVDEPVADRRHVPERDDGSVEPGNQRNVLELCADLPFRIRMQDQASRARAQLAEGHVERRPPHGVGDLVEGEPVSPQVLFAQFDGNLTVPGAEQRHLGDRRQLEQVLAQILGRKPQVVLGGRRGRYRESHDLDVQSRVLDFRLFGRSRREVLDTIHRALHVAENGVGVGEGRKLDPDFAKAFIGGCHDPLGTGQADHVLLEPANDVLLNLLRRRAGGRDRHGHGSEIEIGKTLNGEVGSGDQAANDEERHEHVGGDGVAGKIC